MLSLYLEGERHSHCNNNPFVNKQVAKGLPRWLQWVKNPPTNAGDVRDTGSIPGLGRSPGGGCGNPLQYFCLENPMDRGDWWATVHGVAESDTTEAT